MFVESRLNGNKNTRPLSALAGALTCSFNEIATLWFSNLDRKLWQFIGEHVQRYKHFSLFPLKTACRDRTRGSSVWGLAVAYVFCISPAFNVQGPFLFVAPTWAEWAEAYTLIQGGKRDEAVINIFYNLSNKANFIQSSERTDPID